MGRKITWCCVNDPLVEQSKEEKKNNGNFTLNPNLEIYLLIATFNICNQ